MNFNWQILNDKQLKELAAAVPDFNYISYETLLLDDTKILGMIARVRKPIGEVINEQVHQEFYIYGGPEKVYFATLEEDVRNLLIESIFKTIDANVADAQEDALLFTNLKNKLIEWRQNEKQD